MLEHAWNSLLGPTWGPNCALLSATVAVVFAGFVLAGLIARSR